MARSQFTFKFPNAQPGAPVTFSAAVYSSPVDAVADGPTLALDSQRTVAVWTDAAELTATWVDGAGASITAEASLAYPVVTATGGVPGTPPTAASSAIDVMSAEASPALSVAQAGQGIVSGWSVDTVRGTSMVLDVDGIHFNIGPGVYTVTVLVAVQGGHDTTNVTVIPSGSFFQFPFDASVNAARLVEPNNYQWTGTFTTDVDTSFQLFVGVSGGTSPEVVNYVGLDIMRLGALTT